MLQSSRNGSKTISVPPPCQESWEAICYCIAPVWLGRPIILKRPETITPKRALLGTKCAKVLPVLLFNLICTFSSFFPISRLLRHMFQHKFQWWKLAEKTRIVHCWPVLSCLKWEKKDHCANHNLKKYRMAFQSEFFKVGMGNFFKFHYI